MYITSRERNRIHARKTRERKKLQMNLLDARVSELRLESQRLKQMVDERYTADLLVVLSSSADELRDKVEVQSSASICGPSQLVFDPVAEQPDTSSTSQKRIRRRGKYTPQERETIRRERNRMHAKKTRDKKKNQFDQNEAIILELERDTRLLRDYLVSLKIITPEEAIISDRHDKAAKAELALFKVIFSGLLLFTIDFSLFGFE